MSNLATHIPLHVQVCPPCMCEFRLPHMCESVRLLHARVPIYFACASKSLGTSPLGGIPKKGPSLFTEDYRMRAILLGSLHHNSPSSISCRQYEEHVMTLHPSVQKAYLQLH